VWWASHGHGHCHYHLYALRIEREEMIRVMHEHISLSKMYLKFLLGRSCGVKPIYRSSFHSSEKAFGQDSG